MCMVQWTIGTRVIIVLLFFFSQSNQWTSGSSMLITVCPWNWAFTYAMYWQRLWWWWWKKWNDKCRENGSGISVPLKTMDFFKCLLGYIFLPLTKIYWSFPWLNTANRLESISIMLASPHFPVSGTMRSVFNGKWHPTVGKKFLSSVKIPILIMGWKNNK